MEGQRSKARIVIFALVVALLLFACAALLRRSMARESVERRLNDTRTAVNDANVAAADSPLEHGVRTQLSEVLSRATVTTLDRPVIAAAVVPEWKTELQLHWVAREPDVDAIEIRIDQQPPVRLSLPPAELESNRTEARTRVLYSNTIRLPEIEKVFAAVPPGAKVAVALVANGAIVSDPADVMVGAK